MNSFTTQLYSEGFVETLVYKGRTYVKRYKKDDCGYTGLDKSWEYEKGLSDELVEALESRDPLEIMDAM